MTPDPDALVEAYLACFNETDPAARIARLTRTFTVDVTYVDPLADLTGLDQLDAAIAGIQEQFAGLVFAPVGRADGHHRQVRFTWGLGPAGGEPVVVGSDVVVTADDGRIVQVLGFLDRVPT